MAINCFPFRNYDDDNSNKISPAKARKIINQVVLQHLERTTWIVTKVYGDAHFDIQKESALLFSFDYNTGTLDAGSNSNADTYRFFRVFAITENPKAIMVGSTVRIGFRNNDITQKPYIKSHFPGLGAYQQMAPDEEPPVFSIVGMWLRAEGNYQQNNTALVLPEHATSFTKLENEYDIKYTWQAAQGGTNNDLGADPYGIIVDKWGQLNLVYPEYNDAGTSIQNIKILVLKDEFNLVFDFELLQAYTIDVSADTYQNGSLGADSFRRISRVFYDPQLDVLHITGYLMAENQPSVPSAAKIWTLVREPFSNATDKWWTEPQVTSLDNVYGWSNFSIADIYFLKANFQGGLVSEVLLGQYDSGAYTWEIITRKNKNEFVGDGLVYNAPGTARNGGSPDQPDRGWPWHNNKFHLVIGANKEDGTQRHLVSLLTDQLGNVDRNLYTIDTEGEQNPTYTLNSVMTAYTNGWKSYYDNYFANHEDTTGTYNYVFDGDTYGLPWENIRSFGGIMDSSKQIRAYGGGNVPPNSMQFWRTYSDQPNPHQPDPYGTEPPQDDDINATPYVTWKVNKQFPVNGYFQTLPATKPNLQPKNFSRCKWAGDSSVPGLVLAEDGTGYFAFLYPYQTMEPGMIQGSEFGMSYSIIEDDHVPGGYVTGAGIDFTASQMFLKTISGSTNPTTGAFPVDQDEWVVWYSRVERRDYHVPVCGVVYKTYIGKINPDGTFSTMIDVGNNMFTGIKYNLQQWHQDFPDSGIVNHLPSEETTIISESVPIPDNVWQLIPAGNFLFVLRDYRPEWDDNPRPIIEVRDKDTLAVLWSKTDIVPTNTFNSDLTYVNGENTVTVAQAGDLRYNVHGPYNAGPRMKAQIKGTLGSGGSIEVVVVCESYTKEIPFGFPGHANPSYRVDTTVITVENDISGLQVNHFYDENGSGWPALSCRAKECAMMAIGNNFAVYPKRFDNEWHLVAIRGT